MKPFKPVKRFVLGIRTTSNLNPSFNTLLIIHKESWDTSEEAVQYCNEHPNWKLGSHPHCGIIQLSQEEMNYYNNI